MTAIVDDFDGPDLGYEKQPDQWSSGDDDALVPELVVDWISG